MLSGRKGVSPLIAAVLLIAFTMAVAAMLTAWISNFTTTEKEKTAVFEEKISCAYQSIRADPEFVRWNSTTGVFQDYIVNTGTVDVELTQFKVWVGGVPKIPEKMNGTLKKDTGSIVNLNLSGLVLSGEDLTKIQFMTRCESVFSSVSKPISGWSGISDTSLSWNN